VHFGHKNDLNGNKNPKLLCLGHVYDSHSNSSSETSFIHSFLSSVGAPRCYDEGLQLPLLKVHPLVAPSTTLEAAEAPDLYLSIY
jgi:hypothetical protein